MLAVEAANNFDNAPSDEPVARAQSAGKKILILAIGSRGDVQPFCALGEALQNAGFTVCMGTCVNHVPFFKSFGIKAVGVAVSSEEFNDRVKVRDAMAKGDVLTFLQAVGELNNEVFPDQLRATEELVDEFKPDVMISGPLTMYETTAIAGVKKIPMMLAALQVIFPAKNMSSVLDEPAWFPHGICGTVVLALIANGEISCKKRVLLDRLGPNAEDYMWTNFREFMLYYMHPIAPFLVAFSPSLCTMQEDWTKEIALQTAFTGFWVVDKGEQEKRMRMRDSMFGGQDLMHQIGPFLSSGCLPPVYMGWGSMIAVSPQHMTCLAVRSLMRANLRGIIVGGYAKLDASMLEGEADSEAMKEYAKENVLFTPSAPHEWLFRLCSVIIHHGGSGTTAAAMRSGVPTIVTPCLLDQFQNSNIVRSNGVGIAIGQLAKVTVDDLASAMRKCTTDKSMQAKAKTLAETLQKEDGLGVAVRVVDDWIQNDVDTGKWKTITERRVREYKELRQQRPPSCLAWIGRMCCSPLPNDYSVKLDE